MTASSHPHDGNGVAGSMKRRREDWVALPEAKLTSRVMLTSIATYGTVFGVFTSIQSSLLYGTMSEILRGSPPSPVWELFIRTTVNLLATGLLVVLVALVRPERRSGWTRAFVVFGICLAISVARSVLQVAAGIYSVTSADSRSALLLEIITTTLVALVIVTAALVQERLWRRVSQAERARFQAQRRANQLLRELQSEELRVRRDVSQVLHGSVQTVFVALEAQLDAVAARNPQDAEAVRTVTAELARLREGELRTLAGALYPMDLERGVSAALTTLLARVPDDIAVSASFAGAAARLDAHDVETSTRVLVVRIVEEGISNALRHGHARALAVRLTEDDARVEIVVDHAGTAPAADAPWSGLARLMQYLELLDGTIELRPGGDLGGGRLRATLTATSRAP